MSSGQREAYRVLLMMRGRKRQWVEDKSVCNAPDGSDYREMTFNQICPALVVIEICY